MMAEVAGVSPVCVTADTLDDKGHEDYQIAAKSSLSKSLLEFGAEHLGGVNNKEKMAEVRSR